MYLNARKKKPRERKNPHYVRDHHTNSHNACMRTKSAIRICIVISLIYFFFVNSQHKYIQYYYFQKGCRCTNTHKQRRQQRKKQICDRAYNNATHLDLLLVLIQKCHVIFFALHGMKRDGERSQSEAKTMHQNAATVYYCRITTTQHYIYMIILYTQSK